MRRLIDIIIQFKEYLILIILSIVSFALLSSNDNIQIRALRSYTLGAMGFFHDVVSVIPNVFELKRENEILRQLNVNLSDEVSRLRELRLENLKLRQMIGLKERKDFRFIPADIIGKDLHLLRNTITLNVGELDSIKPDMAIISESGLVGRIITTSSRYSIGQLMLNKDFRASAKVQRSRVDGIISWDGGNYLILLNVAKTQDVKEGDIVITSEYSTMFPRNIKIGVVSKVAFQKGNLFKEIEVIPAVDFSMLEQVFVVISQPDSELVSLSKKATRAK